MHAVLDTRTEVSELRYDMHYGLEFGIVLSGRMRRRYRTWEIELGPGEAWFCGIWERHGWAVVEAPCEVLVVVILPQALANPEPLKSIPHDWLTPFLVPPEHRPVVPPEARQQLLAVAQQIRARLAGRNQWKGMWLRLLTFEALSLFDRGWTAPGRRASLPRSYEGVGRAVELAFDGRRLVTTEEAAQACAMSSRTFRRAFESLMGISFSKFALRYRLSGVAAELARSEEPLKTIASRWGFVDASHLHRCFAQHYRCTPEAYRRRATAANADQRRTATAGDASGGTRSGRCRSGG